MIETDESKQFQQPGRPDRFLVAPGRYSLDPSHTLVTWCVNHNGFSMVRGQFGASSGWLSIDPSKPDEARGEVEFALAELTTPVTHFTNHLKSADFFDVERHPTAVFRVTSLKADGDRATVNGDLSIKGVTKPTSLEAAFVGAGTNPTTTLLTFGFGARTTIKRSEFGLGMAVPFVGDDVDLIIDAAFVAT